jgi:antitoxin Phd
MSTGSAAAIGGDVVHMSSTEAQNGFGRLLDIVARGGTVHITRHNTTQAVLMSVEQYEALSQTEAPSLDALTAEFDALLERMQKPEVRAGIHAGLSASPAELAQAARAASRRLTA